MLKQHVTLEFFTCKLAASHWVNCQTTSQIYNPERDKVKQVFHTSLSNESHNPHDLAWGYYWKITTLPLLSKEDFPTPPPFSQFNPNKHIFPSLTLHYSTSTNYLQLYRPRPDTCRVPGHPPTFRTPTQPEIIDPGEGEGERGGQNDGSKRQSTECCAIIHVMNFILSKCGKKIFTLHKSRKKV